MSKFSKSILAVSALLLGNSLTIGSVQAQELSFEQYVEKLKQQGREEGISEAIIDEAFDGVTFKPRAVKADKNQPEKKLTLDEYIPRAVPDWKVKQARSLYKKHYKALKRIGDEYGVQPRFIVALWGVESNFGKFTGNYSVIDALTTMAYEGRREAFFRSEAMAALTILDQGHITPKEMKGSWAGAMGQPQFLPSSYLDYAVDYDGDGRRDIWNSVPDTLGSIANYLAQYGWQEGRDWGYEAIFPTRVSCALEGPDQMRKIRKWAKAGVNRISGKAFPELELNREGALLMPAGRFGPAFVATPNFYVIKKYNNSDLYALFVGNAADRIQYSNKPFVAQWRKISGLTRGNVMAIQKGLISQGYDVGGADGLAGFKTRRSIGDWQQKNGLEPTCFPSATLAERF